MESSNHRNVPCNAYSKFLCFFHFHTHSPNVRVFISYLTCFEQNTILPCFIGKNILGHHVIKTGVSQKKERKTPTIVFNANTQELSSGQNNCYN